MLHGIRRQPADSVCAPALWGVHDNPHTFSVHPPPKAVPSAVIPSASDQQVNTMAAGRGDTTVVTIGDMNTTMLGLEGKLVALRTAMVIVSGAHGEEELNALLYEAST